MAHEADYDVEFFAELARSGGRGRQQPNSPGERENEAKVATKVDRLSNVRTRGRS